jgi:hypothetical protein
VLAVRVLALRLGAATRLTSGRAHQNGANGRSITSCRHLPTWRVCRHLNAGSSRPMPRFINDDLTPRGDAGDVREDPEAVAGRLRVEMRSAVCSLRARLPEAFPRWQQRRRDAVHTASDRSE